MPDVRVKNIVKLLRLSTLDARVKTDMKFHRLPMPKARSVIDVATTNDRAIVKPALSLSEMCQAPKSANVI
jgi:hypothetical protein